MRKLILSVIFSFYCLITFAQNGVPQNAGARGAAMANASLTFTDINSIFANQAGLGYLENLSFTAYGERRFLAADGLNSFLFGVAYPHKTIGTIGLSVNYFGYGQYNEQKIGLSYARKLFKRMSIGAQFNYIGTRFGDGYYGTANSFTFEVGILAKVTKHFHLAAHAYSPARIELPNGDVLPSVFKLGGAYMPSDKVRITAEIEKDLENPFNGRFGIEYHPISILYIRAGVATTPILASFGFGLNMKGLKIDIAASYHMVLGVSPCLSVTYVVGDKKPEKAAAE
jgi:hypothetical protein